MLDYAHRKGLPMRSVSAMRDHASEFVDLVVDELIALDVELVGFTSTFMQNLPSLAVARRLAARRPDITILFGGGNCDGPMGVALHREFDFVDLVVRGDVLRRMDKGIKAVHNVRTMRDCESAGLTVAWNWLYGFPGERLADYTDVVAQLPALVHLQPPDSTARIELNRFSPYFENTALGFPVREPAEPYGYVYDLTPDQLADMVYLFDTPQAGLTEGEVGPLNAAVAAWIRDYPASSLRRIDVDDVVVLRDRRVGWPQEDHVLARAREKQAWTELEHGRSVRGLVSRLGWDPSEWLGSLRERGLVFQEGGRWVALATSVIR